MLLGSLLITWRTPVGIGQLYWACRIRLWMAFRYPLSRPRLSSVVEGQRVSFFCADEIVLGGVVESQLLQAVLAVDHGWPIPRLKNQARSLLEYGIESILKFPLFLPLLSLPHIVLRSDPKEQRRLGSVLVDGVQMVTLLLNTGSLPSCASRASFRCSGCVRSACPTSHLR